MSSEIMERSFRPSRSKDRKIYIDEKAFDAFPLSSHQFARIYKAKDPQFSIEQKGGAGEFYFCCKVRGLLRMSLIWIGRFPQEVQRALRECGDISEMRANGYYLKMDPAWKNGYLTWEITGPRGLDFLKA